MGGRAGRALKTYPDAPHTACVAGARHGPPARSRLHCRCGEGAEWARACGGRLWKGRRIAPCRRSHRVAPPRHGQSERRPARAADAGGSWTGGVRDGGELSPPPPLPDGRGRDASPSPAGAGKKGTEKAAGARSGPEPCHGQGHRDRLQPGGADLHGSKNRERRGACRAVSTGASRLASLRCFPTGVGVGWADRPHLLLIRGGCDPHSNHSVSAGRTRTTS